ncbi:MAG: ATP-binding cassette domain-containing protein [Deltaproteobacteria bacterium]|jgi:ABC-type multidrug transport system fused ATPase/permease subunit|nr:ATP-binding cassette domain-containing protein [Deltaproteobacteria bacterium]
MTFPLVKTARAFHRAFLQDSMRLGRALPRRLQARWLTVIAIQFLTGLLEMLALVAISVFAMSVAAPESVPENFLIRPILNLFPALREIFGSPRRLVALASAVMMLSIAVKCASAALAARLSAGLSERIVAETSSEAFRLYVGREFLFHLSPESHETVLKIINRHLLTAYALNLLNFFSTAIICLTLFLSLAALEPRLTAAVGLVFGTAALLLYSAFRRRLDREGSSVHRCAEDENRILMAASKGIREIIIHRGQGAAAESFAEALQRGVRPRSMLTFLNILPAQILETLGFATMGSLVVGMLAAKMPMEDIVQTTTLLMLTAWRLLPLVNRSLVSSVTIRGMRPSAMNFLDLIERFRRESGGPPPSPEPGFGFSRDLELRGVSFRYPGACEDSLREVSLRIAKGSRVGLIGASGSGKSTLALILSGLVSPARGDFLVDGRPLSPAGREAYFRLLGYVPQAPLLLDGTLAQNVAFADRGKEPDLPRIRAALRMAAADFAEDGPEGLFQRLSSASQSLSGGQIQRVAIARALYGDPRILLFDEATSALDRASENIVRRTLSGAGSSATCIVIAHRLSAVGFCDTLHWLEGGRIVRSGPPSEIIPLYLKDAELAETRLAAAAAAAGANFAAAKDDGGAVSPAEAGGGPGSPAEAGGGN